MSLLLKPVAVFDVDSGLPKSQLIGVTLNGSKMRAGTGFPFSSRMKVWLKLPTRSSAVGTVSSDVVSWSLRNP